MRNITRKDNGPVIRQKIYNNMEYLTFPILEDSGWIRHAFTTRVGGISKGIYGEANYSYSRGDDPACVDENLMRMGEILGVGRDLDRFVLTAQTHTTNIAVAGPEDAGRGIRGENAYTDTDGLITDVPGLILTSYHADCPVVYLADHVHRAVGLVHSGWKGTAGRIAAKAVRKMHETYGTDPADIIAAIGPSICPDCYEVSSDVADVFISGFKGTENIIRLKSDGKYLLSLWAAIKETLLEEGVRAGAIEVTDICTRCNPGYLFSHRYAGDKRGNNAAFIMIDPGDNISEA
ncbi:peptidoglycan editing factor PgeF [Butyrivibrio sp. MC2013]|uniref:peptidoglycan editing factor PgeF n=1 Tax=Butyrivibrio sp. MC2013 TaxID=1280686 RepID=UPI0003FD7663|nr:peptidoglycan editing factor PgeF [Butyrivibrio sp. MC2013]